MHFILRQTPFVYDVLLQKAYVQAFDKLQELYLAFRAEM
jgi:hypothetical protein